MGMLIRLAINAIALWITTLVVPGVDVGGRYARPHRAHAARGGR